MRRIVPAGGSWLEKLLDRRRPKAERDSREARSPTVVARVPRPSRVERLIAAIATVAWSVLQYDVEGLFLSGEASQSPVGVSSKAVPRRAFTCSNSNGLRNAMAFGSKGMSRSPVENDKTAVAALMNPSLQ